MTDAAPPGAGPSRSPAGAAPLHPTLRAAADGRLPPWARCTDDREAHLRRVTALMNQWAGETGVGEADRARWRAAGLLHDALKDAEAAELRELTGAARGWPPALLHGLACAERLRRDGVADEELLRAVEYHSVGHPDFGSLGDHLYLADFLEPGRRILDDRRAELRQRVPADAAGVLLEVVELRLRHLLAARRRVLVETLEFWNRRVGG